MNPTVHVTSAAQSAVPPNHNITGTCGHCGGMVVQPMMWSGSGQPNEYCVVCGRQAKPLHPVFSPMREMYPKV